MTGDLVPVVAGYLAHKRALGRKFHNEEKNLDLLVAFAYGRCGWREVAEVWRR